MDPLERLPRIALTLDSGGCIQRVNGAWLARGLVRGLSAPDAWLGVSYPALCHAARGRWTEGAREVADAVESVLGGGRQAADVGYACDPPGGSAWFTLAIRSLPGVGGALLVHLDAPDPRGLSARDRHLTDVAWRHLLGVETRCAWCARLADPDGTWHDRRPVDPSRVSDGLCPSCEHGMLRELAMDGVGAT